MDNSLAKNYKLSSLFFYALPNMIMMLFLSLYTIVDGTFVSKYVSTTALSSVNMVYPIISIEMAIGIMIATGGNAIIAKKMGENKYKESRENFTYLILVEVLIGIFIGIFGNIFIDNIISFLGATSSQFELCKTYLRILLYFAPLFFLQTAFQTFFVTAGKPTIGLIVTLLAGVTNIGLDYLFIKVFGMGISGAAIATGIGYFIVAIVGIVYFTFFRNKQLYFVKPKKSKKLLFNTCINGSSEMVTNIANAITTFLFNYQFLKYYGEDGVAAITIILYFQFIVTAIFFGYSNGIAPIISFKYGEKNKKQLKEIFKNSIIIVAISTIVSIIFSYIILKPSLNLFTTTGSNVYNIVMYGFKLYSISFLFAGTSIFASAWFTALSNGKISALISFSRTFVFLASMILLLPLLLGVNGVWLSVAVAEFLGIILSIMCLKKYKKVYEY